MLRHAEDYQRYQISEWDRNLIRPNYVTHPLNVSLFIDGSETSANAQVLCVHVRAFVLAFACIQDRCVWQAGANVFKLRCNQIGSDLGRQGLRAILITPL